MTEYSDKDALRAILAVSSDQSDVLTGPDGWRMSGEDLRARIESHWAQLERTVPTGARIATLLPDTPHTAIALLALSHHARVMPLNPAMTPAEIRASLTAARVDALVLPARSAPLDLPCPHGRIDEDGAISLPDLDIPADKAPGLVLMTSGSTGAPKRVPLSCTQLRISADKIARALDLTRSDRAVHALPMFHIGAIVDLLLAPLISGSSVRFAGGMGAAALRDAVLVGGATWMQLVPTMLNRLRVDLSPDDARRMGEKLRFIRSVSADLAPPVHAQAEAFFAGTPIIQMYGMTETAGQIATNPLPPQRRKPGTVGTAFELDLRIAQDGEVQVRGDTVMSGYENRPDADHLTSDGWLRTGDLGRLDADGFVTLTGRAKDIINRGGEKISPYDVEHAALACPHVTDAAAFAIPHPSLGEDVGLAVTLTPDGDAETLKTHLATVLAPFKRPRHPLVLDALPRLGSGKIDRRALVNMGPARSGVSGTHHKGIAAQIAQAWRAVLPKTPETGPDASTDFFDAGGDSLAGAQFVYEVERVTGRSVPPNQLFETPVFADFVQSVVAAPRREDPGGDPKIAFLRDRLATWNAAPVDGAPIFRKLDGGPGAPLFWCVQEEDEFNQLAATVTPHRPLYLMRSLFLMLGKSDQMNRALAQEYAATIHALQPDGALRLGGFCEGAKIMRFAAEALVGMGRQVALLVSWDQWFDDPVAVPVLHFWSDDRFAKYSRAHADPTKAIAAAHPAGYQIIRLPGGHSEILTKGPLGIFARRFNSALQDGLKQNGPPSTFARPHSGRVSLTCKRLLRTRRSSVVQLDLTRMSPALPATPDAPLLLIAQFTNLDGHTHPDLAWTCLLDGTSAAGTRVDLPIAAPAKKLPMWLTVDLVDDMGRRASDAGLTMPRKLVWVIG